MSQRRGFGRPLRALAIIAGTLLLAAAPVWAHVDIDPGSEPKGAAAVFSFRVPNEEPNANTVRLDVQFPLDHPFANVLVQAKTGWTFSTQSQPLAKPIKARDGTFTQAVTEVSWTATTGGIPPGAFDLFPVFAALPKQGTKLTFKAIQTYSNGDVVRWIETPAKGAPPPDNPAPVLVLTKTQRSRG
jgi:uncharacterized protein YcnI